MVEFIQKVESHSNKRLFLPDSVAVLDDGSFVVADSGNDRICLFDVDGNALKSIGGKGFGKYRFKEPVGVFVSPGQEIYVTDWHNHRVAVYDKDLQYLGEFGHYGKPKSGGSLNTIAHNVICFLRALAYAGSYVPRHFSSDIETDGGRFYSLSLLLHGLIYWWRRNGSIAAALKMMVSSYDAIDKPNGVAFYHDKIVVSQKNSRCLSVYEKSNDSQLYMPVAHHFGPSDNPRFGRLGNITYDIQGCLYVCDERSNVIWRLDADFGLVDIIVGRDSGTGSFLPFSCCHIKEDILVVCGGLNFQVIDLRDKGVIYCSENIGELHSVAYDGNFEKLYVTDRSNGVIRVYQVTTDFY